VLRVEPSADNIQMLRDMLDDPDRDVRATVLNALVGLRVPDSGPLAAAALADPDGLVRAAAAKLLGDIGDTGHSSALAEVLLADPDPIARQRAAESLGRLAGDGAATALVAALDDPVPQVRLVAVEGLEHVPDPSGPPERLLDLLRDDPVWEVRALAARALGRTARPELVEALRRAAAEDANEFVRAAAANVLRAGERAPDPRPASGSGPPD
jgi:HEAT repeat protein